MKTSAAVSADLPEKKGTDGVNDALTDHNHGSSSGAKGVHTGISGGDTDETADGQLPIKKLKKERTPTQKLSDKKYCEERKRKADHYPEVCNELLKKTLECEHLREQLKWKDQRLQQYESQVTSMLSDIAHEKQQSQNWYHFTQELYKEKEELKKERDELKKENEQLKKNDVALDIDDLWNLPAPDGQESEMHSMG